MAHPPHVRASDADRERVAERLRQAATDGRLTAEELEERLHTVFLAQTYGELRPVVSDLPDDRTPVIAGQPQTSGMAIASVALGLFWMGGVGSLAAVVLGVLARKEIARSNGLRTGRGLAVGGIVLGCVGVLGAAALIVLSALAGFIGHPFHPEFYR